MQKKTSLLRSLTRLAIGGVLVAIDELSERLPEWESAAAAENPVEALPEQIIEENPNSSPLQDGLIGLVFDLQDQVQSNLDRLDRLTRWVSKSSSKLLRPITRSRVGVDIAHRVDRLAERGQSQIDRWVEIGQIEGAHSKAVLRAAIDKSVDRVVSDLTVNPEVQQLVQSQSATLAGEVVDEVRERTISADNFLEVFTRSMLRRPSREALPEPPPEVADQAKPFRRFQGRTIRK